MLVNHKISAFLAIGLVLLQLFGCSVNRNNKNPNSTIDNKTDVTSKTETPLETEIAVPTDKIKYDRTVSESQYYKIVESSEHFIYAYFIYDKNGNTARSEEGLLCAPAVSVNEDGIVSVILSEGTGIFGQQTYYYDHNADKFSDRINSVYCEHNGIVASLDTDKIIVRNIFDKNVFYTEISTSDFKKPMADSMEPIIGVSFIENGTKLKVIYLTGAVGSVEEAMEIFNLGMK